MKNLVIVRGGGDIATGTIHKLHSCGLKVLVLETEKPSSIRRRVSFSEAVYEGETSVEGTKAVLVRTKNEVQEAFKKDFIPVAVDMKGEFIKSLKPKVVVDAILAKKNLGTTKAMAPITIALGPGFEAGIEVDAVIETMRGHDLGRIILKGYALKNTGCPGVISGYSVERVIYSPHEGIIRNIKNIGEIVKSGEVIALIDGEKIKTDISGVLRGIIRDGYEVSKGLKIADIDPRYEERRNCETISDKARCIAGSVLEAIILLQEKSIINL